MVRRSIADIISFLEEEIMSQPDLLRRSVLRGFSALPLAAWAGQSRAQPLPKVKFVGGAPVARPDQGFMFLGIPLGFFKQLGVDTEFMTVAGASTVIQLIANNEGQLGHCGMIELIAAKQRQPNLPVRAVYLIDPLGSYDIVVPTSSPIRSMADFKGKKIGVINLGSSSVTFIKAMLHNNKIDENSVEILPVGTGAQALAALKAGRVDALSLFHTALAVFETMGMQFRYFSVNFLGAVLLANEKFRLENREALVRALRGVILNTNYIIANPEASVRTAWKLIGKPPGDEQKAIQAGAHVIKRAVETWKDPRSTAQWGRMSDEHWLRVGEFMRMQVNRDLVSSLYTNDLIDDANNVDVNVALKTAKSG